MNMKERRIIKVVANHSARTFTLRIVYPDGSKTKYRTIPLSKEEFNSNLHNTINDWNQFLKSDDYYRVKQ